MVSSLSPPSPLLLFFLLTLPFLSIILVVYVLWPSHLLRPLLLVHCLSRHILYVLGLVLHLISIIPLATVCLLSQSRLLIVRHISNRVFLIVKIWQILDTPGAKRNIFKQKAPKLTLPQGAIVHMLLIDRWYVAECNKHVCVNFILFSLFFPVYQSPMLTHA
jgi:hypothetical protein